jgi:magnesium transporter
MPVYRLWPNARQAVRDRNYSVLPSILQDWSPADLAEFMLDLPASQQAIILRSLPPRKGVATFRRLYPTAQHFLLQSMSKDEAAVFLNGMAPDDRAMLLEELPEEASREYIGLLSPEERILTEKLFEFPEGSVGRLMTTEFLTLRSYWTIQRSLEWIRKSGSEIESFDFLYVVDDQGRMAGSPLPGGDVHGHRHGLF